MHRFVIRLAAIIAAVALVGLGLTVAPVSATIQVLCKGVSKADVAKCNPAYAKDMSKMHWRMYGGHNCVNYVAWQLGQNGVPTPKRLMGNARAWSANAKKEGYTVNKTPAVGSVGAWGKAKNHVTYVTEVGSNYILTQEDNYPGYYPKGIYQKLKIYKGDRSYPTEFIHFKDLISSDTPVVSGTAAVGSPVTASAGSWRPTGVAFTYKWLRNDTVIRGANARTYTPDASDLGKKLAVQVSGKRTGYATAAETSAPTDAVRAGTLANTAGPTIAGTPKVGAKLSVLPGSWAPSAVGYSYRWLRNGVAIAGATGSTYIPIAADAATKISATVTASLAGYSSKSVTTQRTTTVAAAYAFAVPEKLRSTEQTDTALKLAWNAVPKAAKYQLQISATSDMAESKYHSFTGTTGTVTGLKASSKYYFRIFVVDAAVKNRLSEISANAEAVTRPAGESLPTPTALTATAKGTDALSLSWAAVPRAQKYQVQLSTSANMTSAKTATFDGTSGTIKDLKSATKYYLRIWVTDATGKKRMSGISATVSATTATKKADAATYSAPQKLKSTSQTQSALNLDWESVSGAPKYRVQLSTSSSMKAPKYYTFAKSSGTIKGLKASTTYYFTIYVVDARVKTRLSPVAPVSTAKTRAKSGTFTAPAGLRAAHLTKSSIGLDWKSVSGAPKYRVRLSRSSNMSSPKYYTFTKSSGTIKGLKASTKYYFTVYVVDARVTKLLSKISKTRSATTSKK